MSNFILNNSKCIKSKQCWCVRSWAIQFLTWAQIAALWFAINVASTSKHRRLYWNKSFLLWYLFSFRTIYLKHLVNICIKTPAVPAFPVFGYFFVTWIYVSTKYMKFKRLFKKCLFQSCSSMLLQSFLSKGKKQSKSIRVWLVAILHNNMWIDSDRANLLLLLSFLFNRFNSNDSAGSAVATVEPLMTQVRNMTIGTVA